VSRSVNRPSADVPDGMTATAMKQPRIAFWKTGKKSNEQGWAFDGVSLSLKDIESTRSFVELQSKGVPQHICAAAKSAGFFSSEIGEYLEESGLSE